MAPRRGARPRRSDVPRTQIILNHAGLPADRSADGLRGWREGMKRLAGAPNAAVKISGLGQPGRPWSAEDNRPIVLDTIDIFGLDRCMFASNFPVDSLVATFRTIYEGIIAITETLTPEEHMKLP